MKLIEYKQFGNIEEEKKLNKKKVLIASSVFAFILFISIIIIIYVNNSSFRDFTDKYLWMKNISGNNIPYITLDADDNIYTYAFHDNIAILKNNELNLYNSSGKIAQTLNVNISTPVFESAGKYLVIAEKNHQKVYLIKGRKIVWEKNVDGNISRVSVNENGSVAIIVSGTSYKSVIITYDGEGNEIFKTYLSSTLATEAVISNDNKYLSFCELDISGTMVESKVKTISIAEASQNPENSIIYTYNLPSNMLVNSLEYQQKNALICMCNSQICSLKNGNIEIVEKIENENVSFAGIKLSKSYFKVVENINGINNQTTSIEICSTMNNGLNKYVIKGIAKDVSSKDGIIAVNMGNEAYFVDEKGWLIKKFTTNQEIKDIVVADNIAGIIFRNKIQFIGF